MRIISLVLHTFLGRYLILLLLHHSFSLAYKVTDLIGHGDSWRVPNIGQCKTTLALNRKVIMKSFHSDRVCRHLGTVVLYTSSHSNS